MSQSDRHYSPADKRLMQFDTALRTLFGSPVRGDSSRASPARTVDETELSPPERTHAARLMRVNHTGEVCAQALYQGQALSARQTAVAESLQQAAAEENDHLVWCEARIKELGGRTSALNPLFYASSFALGTIAGKLGDKWSLGFLAATEHQVVEHLDKYLQRLPSEDRKSRAILATMKEDEANHESAAQAAGGASLPPPVRLLMKAASKVMTKTTYWL